MQLRLKKRLSQEELAERAGTTQQTISQLECGHHAAQGRTLLKLAEAMGVVLEKLEKSHEYDPLDPLSAF